HELELLPRLDALHLVGRRAFALELIDHRVDGRFDLGQGVAGARRRDQLERTDILIRILKYRNAGRDLLVVDERLGDARDPRVAEDVAEQIERGLVGAVHADGRPGDEQA